MCHILSLEIDIVCSFSIVGLMVQVQLKRFVFHILKMYKHIINLNSLLQDGVTASCVNCFKMEFNKLMEDKVVDGYLSWRHYGVSMDILITSTG